MTNGLQFSHPNPSAMRPAAPRRGRLADVLTESYVVDLVEQELGHACDDPDQFEEIVFRLGLAA